MGEYTHLPSHLLAGPTDNVTNVKFVTNWYKDPGVRFIKWDKYIILAIVFAPDDFAAGSGTIFRRRANQVILSRNSVETVQLGPEAPIQAPATPLAEIQVPYIQSAAGTPAPPDNARAGPIRARQSNHSQPQRAGAALSGRPC